MKPDDMPNKPVKSTTKATSKAQKKTFNKKLKDDNANSTTPKLKGDKIKLRGKKNKGQEKLEERIILEENAGTEVKVESANITETEEWGEQVNAGIEKTPTGWGKKTQKNGSSRRNSADFEENEKQNVEESEEGANEESYFEENEKQNMEELDEEANEESDEKSEEEAQKEKEDVEKGEKEEGEADMEEEDDVENEQTVNTENKKTGDELKKTSEMRENKSEYAKTEEEAPNETKKKIEFKKSSKKKKSKNPSTMKESKKENERSKMNTHKTKNKPTNILNLKDLHKIDIKQVMSNKDLIFKKAESKVKTYIKSTANDLMLNTQDKDVFEYVPDNSSYNICHNDPNELYKDVINMNKHLLDEMHSNIYATPLNAYLSNVLNDSQNISSFKSKKYSADDNFHMKYDKGNTVTDKPEKTVDETSNEPKCAYEYFKDKVFKYYDNGVMIEIDPTQLKYNDSTEYEYNQNLDTYKTDPLAYLNKLKCEIEDITQYIKNLAEIDEPIMLSSKEKTISSTTQTIEKDKIMKQILHNREIPELLLELHSLEKDINNILLDEKTQKILSTDTKKKNLDESTLKKTSEETELQNLFKIISNLKDNKLENGEAFLKSNSATNLKKIFNIYAVKNQDEEKERKDIQVNDLLILERKITDLETSLGIEKMSLLPYDDINQAIIDLYNKLSLLDSNKLESIKKKVQILQSEFVALKKSQREILSIAKDRSNYEESIDELFKMLEIWKKTHHILPNILTRLHQLKVVHDNAQSFATRLNDLEDQQRKLNDTLASAKVNIKLLNDRIDENVNFLQETLKKIEGSVLKKNHM